ncbi:cation:dicarboxylase symporter family transporter [Pseudomonas sp. PS02288]|uniref:cation:dicarboxylate symporter family transporter n=1 Tax=Pseudomonas sp. PS02288 TaxID=2991443 RepID=UPI00249AA102|nr:cation:dicarboxylase symporter family transporter [Pseudomonas sp. PS02288]
MILKLARNPTLQIVVAVSAGILLGLWRPDLAMAMKPLGSGFLQLVGWVIPPLMFVLVTSGVARLRCRRQARGLGARTLVYFEALKVLALLCGLLGALLLRPGDGFSPPPEFPAHALAAQVHSAVQGTERMVEAGAGVSPLHLWQLLSRSPVLQVALLALVCGYLLSRLGAVGEAVLAALDRLLALLFALLRVLLRFAPLAAFSAMAFTIGRYGPGSTVHLLKFIAVIYLTCLAFVGIVLAAASRFAGVGLLRLIAYIKEELLLVASTGSSVIALPGLLRKLERLGCARQSARVVLTTGYTFNLAGSNIYLSCAALFLAQTGNVELGGLQLLGLLLVCLFTSMGSTSIAGSSFLTLAATLSVLPMIPVESAGLLLGVERLMKCRSLTNVLGNCVGCLAIARWHGSLDQTILQRALNPARAVPGRGPLRNTSRGAGGGHAEEPLSGGVTGEDRR